MSGLQDPKHRLNDIQGQLWEAARKGDTTEIRRLVVLGAKVDQRDENGRTALHIASQYQHDEAYKILLAAREMQTLVDGPFDARTLMQGLDNEKRRIFKEN